VKIYSSRRRFCLVGFVLLFCSIASAQVEPPLTRDNRKVLTEVKPAEKGAEATSMEQRKRFKEAVEYSALNADPCVIVTRDELEAIFKRSDNDRALVTMPTKPNWQFDRKKVDCSYSVNYENRIFPDQGYDNGVVISIDFDDKFARQGKLVADRPVVYGYPMELEIVNGLGNEAFYLRDVSRIKHEERDKSTAGAEQYQYWDNQDFLLVRQKGLVLKFQITRTVAGNTGNYNLIQIARKALVRVP
jgi:hypothetical protein